MPPEQGANPQRILSIDIIRGFALCCMVVIHFMIYFGNAEAMRTGLYFSLNHILGDWGAGCFLILMGMSQVLSEQAHRGLHHALLFKRALIRGGFIMTVGLLMLALAWGVHEIWRWDILTLMGLATVVLFFCRFLPSWAILLIAAAVAVSTPYLRGLLAITPLWSKNFIAVPVVSDYLPGILYDPAGELEVGQGLAAILQGFLFTGEFPLFPWVLFPLVGFVLGRRAAACKIRQDLPLLFFLAGTSLFLGLGMAYAGSLRPESSIISDYLTPLSFYPDSFSMIFLQLGMSLLFLFILYDWYDLRGAGQKKPGPVAGLFTHVSRSSLTFYFLHYLLIGWPLALIALFTGRTCIYNLTGAWTAFFCGLAAVALLASGLALWDRKGGKYKLEWFLFVLIRRFANPGPRPAGPKRPGSASGH